MTSREIAERIEEMLAKNNLKKKDFYEKTGITRAAFSLWKNEKAFPSKESLDIINQFLGTTFGVSEIEKAPTVETNSERNAEANAMIGPLLSNFMRLSQDQQRMIVQQIQALSLLQSNQGDE